MNEASTYEDLFCLPHHVSSSHPKMTALTRAAQFSPFAALSGYDAAVRETARLTEEWVELDESRKEMLDERLQLVREHLPEKPNISVTYFQPDERKHGGTYRTILGRVRKIDEYGRQLCMEDGTLLHMEHIFALEGDLFRELDESWQ